VDSDRDPVLLGRELETARRSAALSLRQVARSAGISAGYLQKLERGQVGNPSPRILQALARVLSISYRRLMELGGYEAPLESDTAHPLTRRLAAASLTEAEERAVAAFVEHLLAQRH
jgi:HTH-type transcriptional regulator, competence development regulator